MGALDGVKVLDISRLLPGPFCSMVLADHGAEVISIEDKRFEKDDLFFTEVYRNKKHITLNLKSGKGKEIFFQLVEASDVIIEGFRPGVAARLGVDYDSVAAVNPGIVYCSISGYGQTGEAKGQAGHDVNYLSRAGVLDLIGEAGRPPAIPGVQIADIAGGMNGVIGVLLALFSRQSTGRGQYVDISMTDGLLGFLTLPWNLKKKWNRSQERSDSLLSHRYACYNTYETSDGRFFSLGAVELRFWDNLCRILEISGYSSLQYDEERREEIISELRGLFITQPLQYWKKLLMDADVCFSPIQNLDEVFEDSLFIERGMVPELEAHGGKTFGIPVRMTGTPGGIRSVPDTFGGSTEEVLRGLGYTIAEIEEFSLKGIV